MHKHIIPTMREADKIAATLGCTRGPGRYNGFPYWRDSQGHILTRDDLARRAGLA